MKEQKHIAVIILAAGESSRLGKPKQLLSFAGQTLLDHAIDTASAFDPLALVIVEGAEPVKSNHTTARIITNPEWREGMASSIRAGIVYISETFSEADAVIIMVCDQPYLDSNLVHTLAAKYEQSSKKIIASAYDDTLGTPMLIDRSLFEDLKNLRGDKGAKSLLKKYPEFVETIDFPKGGIDIDTVADWEQFIKTRK